MNQLSITHTFSEETLSCLEELIGHRLLLLSAPTGKPVGISVSKDFCIGFYTRNVELLMLTQKEGNVTVWEWSNEPHSDTWYGDFGFLSLRKSKELSTLNFFKGVSASHYAKIFQNASTLSANVKINKLKVLGSRGKFRRVNDNEEFLLGVDLDLVVQMGFSNDQIAILDGSSRDNGVGVQFFREKLSLSENGFLRKQNRFAESLFQKEKHMFREQPSS